MKMKKQGKSAGHPRPNHGMKKSPGPNKNNLKDQKAKNKPLKFLNDIKKAEDAKPLVEKFLGQGKVVKNPGKSPKKFKNKNKNNKNQKGMAPRVNLNKNKNKKGMSPHVNPNKNNSKKGMAPPVNPDKNKGKKGMAPPVNPDKNKGKKGMAPPVNPDKNKGKKGMAPPVNPDKNKGKKGMAPPVNPDIDNAVNEESSDEEMNEVNSSEALESPTSSPKKNKIKKKKLGLLAAKKENKEDDDDDVSNEEDENVKENATPNAEGKEKQPKKFCLFVGNLPYDVTEEQVREHFKSLKNGLSAVRLMTDVKTGKGRGFAFIELLNSGAYKAATKLHKRKMGERVIRVEYTTPGKSENKGRKKFMHSKTKKLLGQRKHKKGKGFNKKKGKGKK